MEAPVDVGSSGRPKRRTRKVVDYKEQSGDSPYDLEKYLEKVRKESEQRWVIMVHDTHSALTTWPMTSVSSSCSCSSTPVLQVQCPLDAQINLKLQNILMLLKKCCNHPYLVEYPLDPATQEFKVSSPHFFAVLLPCLRDEVTRL